MAPLPGREELLRTWQEMLADVQTDGRAGGKDYLLLGYRGVGKSVTMQQAVELGQKTGYSTVGLIGNPDTPMVTALFQSALHQAETNDRPSPWQRAVQGLRRIGGVGLDLGGIVKADIKLTETAKPNADVAPASMYDPSAIGSTLARLAEDLRAEQGRGGLILSVDELQMSHERDIRALGGVLNHLNLRHPSAPIVFIGTGLPHTMRVLQGRDPERPLITNPARLFTPVAIPGELSRDAFEDALQRPALERGVRWTAEALDRADEITGRYPAHVQAIGAAAWAQAAGPNKITAVDVAAGQRAALETMEQQYLEPRWNDLTDLQQGYIAAIALCGGEARSGHVAAMLGYESSSEVSEMRDRLIRTGDILEARRGWVAVANPMMTEWAPQKYQETWMNHDPGLPGALPSLTDMAELRDRYTDGRSARDKEALSAAEIARLSWAKPARHVRGSQSRPALEPGRRPGPGRDQDSGRERG
ncbi:hypothetical protein GGQ54_003340 [Naumannella cuiyingiana]|uniref:Orc1-like AAA ATPase domain-containing protein n=1 Tax=Naumannella cuiyingiana TaxID=1347891 RepID=A0A7Z0IMK9_9ACTN|nr:AAA family ATPase [Naumannella cuiyingiana]NYI72726.1 hypothetical protein [Naumannella cuiyingiana]